MKTSYYFVLLILFFSFSACDDDCKNLNDCNGHGECVANTCGCEAGYGGLECESRISDKIIGTYVASVQVDGIFITKTVSITADSNNPAAVVITGITNDICSGVSPSFPFNVVNIANNIQLTITSNNGSGSGYQYICDATVSQLFLSSAVFNSNTITMNFSYFANGISSFYFITMTKQ
jgi:hypothetical protein